MKTELTKLEGNVVELKVEFDSEEWKASQNKVLKRVAQNINVPGFRKGKAPVAMIKQRINMSMLLEDAMEQLLNDRYTQLLKDNGVEPVAQPEVTPDEITEKVLKVTLKIQEKPDVTLGQYKDIEVKKDEVNVTDEDIDNEIKSIQERNAEWVVKEEGEVEEGDTAVIDYEGFMDGVAFEGGKDENHHLVIGSGQFIPGFEDQVKGMKANEEKDIVVTFPEDYQASDLAGKEATFKVVVHEIQYRTLPEIDDELAKDAGIDGVETLEDLKTNIQTRLQNQRETEAEDKYTNELYEKVIENTPIDVPAVMIDNEVNAMLEEVKRNITSQGLDFDTFTKLTGQDENAIREELRPQADSRVRFNLILEAIAKQEELTVSDEELEEEFKQIAQSYGREVDEMKKMLSGVTDSISHDIMMRKAVKVIRDNAK
ncbi:Trigger factor [Clostridiales bacterium CHKCI006]|uniref:Trigger factor n=1 Tax=Candidatus Fimiplasma intestinipullorum TaxID=2840825 RepID=A0A9D1HLL2_9FIRM|nr:Trigger factor [Clostridiales bacterium CHKCI006]HIU12765.1 trigger factor [Candidatus Fimiplasma intestinipullorum]